MRTLGLLLLLSGGNASATPIKHLVVIFQENVSFDHYFATYPNALNKPGEMPFKAAKGTPSINGLTETLLKHNPNSSNPERLGPSQAATCDQDHNYTQEQRAYDGGLLDKFVESTGNGDGPCRARQVLDYFDGNTLAALWRYAQHFAMSDNFYETTFGPSSVGAINLVSGQTHGAVPEELKSRDGERLTAAGTLIDDPDPEFDDCSDPKAGIVRMTGTNIGDLMSKAGVSWGFFEGGFARTNPSSEDKAACALAHRGSDGKLKLDYIPHHEPFQYYKSTANPHHKRWASVDKIGKDDQANHQYDLADFWLAADAGKMPAVSFLKAPAYQDGHAGYSDPIREQAFLVATLNRLQKGPAWKEMAVIVTYDDSDGWYDHVMPPIVNRSNHADADPFCGKAKDGAYPARCGYGPRLPFLVLSPYAKPNFVDHSITDQTSILRFIEDNWKLPRIGGQSFDELAGSLMNMFEFEGGPRNTPLELGSDGLPLKGPAFSNP